MTRPLPKSHDVSMTGFAKYVCSPGEQRYTFVQALLGPYSPFKDPYRGVRNAIKAGRRTGNDQQAMASVIHNCRPQLQASYSEIANGWLTYVKRIKNTVFVEPRTARWHTEDLVVRVTPNLVLEHPDGSTDAVKLYLQTDPILAQAAEIMLWLMQQTLAQTHPGAKPTVLDVRRRRVYTKVPTRAGYTRWLESEAASLAYLHRRLVA